MKSPKPVATTLAKMGGHKKEAKIEQHNTKLCMKFSILVARLLKNKFFNEKAKLCDMLILAEYIDVSQVFL